MKNALKLPLSLSRKKVYSKEILDRMNANNWEHRAPGFSSFGGYPGESQVTLPSQTSHAGFCSTKRTLALLKSWLKSSPLSQRDVETRMVMFLETILAKEPENTANAVMIRDTNPFDTYTVHPLPR